jgi:hypothetical protein
MSDSAALSPLSEAFGEIEHELQIQFNAPCLLVTEVKDISLPHSAAQFATLSKAIVPQNTVTIYVTSAQASAQFQASLADIAAKGIRVDPRSGFRFNVGRVNVDKSAEEIELIRLNVALGSPSNLQQALPVRDTELEFSRESPQPEDLPLGYHSLCLQGGDEYVVFSATQIKVTHLVKLAGGENLKESNEFDDQCDLCKDAHATKWCVTDSAKLCDECDTKIHDGNAIHETHNRMDLPEGRALMEVCPIHSDQRVQYYCPECHVPVCIECKMTGSHSKGEAASHPLITIREAYDKALEAADNEDPIITKRKGVIADKIAAADTTLNEVVDNLGAVEAELTALFQQATIQARRLAGEKALTIRSVRSELVRKQKELDSFAKLIASHRKGSGPLAFLRACDRQDTLVAEFQGTGDLPLDLRVKGDLTVCGGIEVRVGGELGEPSLLSRRDLGESSAYGDSLDSPPRSPKSKKKKDTLWNPISALAKKREAKNLDRGVALDFQPFQGSAIMTNPEQCRALYLSFPFKKTPQTHLLFSTENNGRSIAKLHQLIHGVGITALLVQRGPNIFGGFAAAKWNTDGKPFGENTTSFLFNVTQDAVVPYKPKVPDACVLYATPETLTFGKYDLVLGGNFDECKSTIESSYGVGLVQGSPEAQTFLAGEHAFKADVVEVWGFFMIDQEA